MSKLNQLVHYWLFIWHDYLSAQYASKILILLGFHKMGCNASNAATGPTSQYSAKSPAVDSLTQESKRQIRKIIQKDDIAELAVIMAELCSYLYYFSITD